jgi:nucleoside-diphosphate-sugar epimerase
MKLLVTGSDGYIGSVLAPFLLQRGHEVVGLDTGFYRDGWLYHLEAAKWPQTLNKDIRHITHDDLDGFDAVVHMAELSNDPVGQLNPDITFRINHQGSIALAKLCKEVGIGRFVYTSSCSVYGIGGDEGYKTEESPTNPQTAYACCKVLVERDVMALAGDDFSPTFLRNATAFGPSPRMRFDIVLNNLAALAWTAGEIKMTSDGSPWRPLVHNLDICEAIACTLEAPRKAIHNQIFNVGDTDENYRIKEIAEIVSENFPGCQLTFGKSDGDNRSYRVSFEKIKHCLPGFACHYNAQDGARHLYQTYSQINMSSKTFQYRAYTRLNQLKYLVETRQLDEDLFWRSGDAK